MNSDLYGRFIADLKLKSYAKKSEQSYMRAVRQLQNFCCKALEDITEEEVREYWVYRREQDLLPCNYFLATFTLPEAVQAVAWQHPSGVYDALLDEARSALRTLEADPRFVGCRVSGFFGVLHTWGRQLQYHPHAHFVIPDGGLSADQSRWIAAQDDFLVHVRALSRMFRGKMRSRLEDLALPANIPPEIW